MGGRGLANIPASARPRQGPQPGDRVPHGSGLGDVMGTALRYAVGLYAVLSAGLASAEGLSALSDDAPARRIVQAQPNPASPPAPTPLLDASDPAQLAGAMQEWGWLAKLTTDTSGDPKIDSKISQSTFAVRFYGCRDGKACKSVSLETAYSTDKPVALKAINSWNSNKRFGQAALDDKDHPSLSLAINLEFGVSQKNLESTFEFWRSAVTEFEKAIDW